MALREAPVDLPGMQPSPGQPFGLYLHVPFCITRCGYCDFNTYTPAELGGVNPDAWLVALRTELELAAARLDAPTVNTVFVGGGTPSLLGGGRSMMAAMIIEQEADIYLDWPMASAIATVLLAMTLALYLLYGRLTSVNVARSLR